LRPTSKKLKSYELRQCQRGNVNGYKCSKIKKTKKEKEKKKKPKKGSG
jgi:hypothetical protein